MIENIEPKLVCRLHIFLDDFLYCRYWFLSLDSFLDQFVHLIQVDSGLSNEIIEPNHIFVPDLDSKNVRVHVFGFGRVEDGELEAVVEVTNGSASPVDVGLLEIAFADESSNKDIVGFHLLVFEYTVLCAPDNDSELILIPRRRGDLNRRIYKPLLLFH